MWGFGCSVLFVRRFARLYLILRTDYEGLVDLFVLDVALEEVAEVSIEHRSLVVPGGSEPQRPQDPRHGSR